jgi:chromosomal replication initiation ATPase DnaA
MSSPASVHVADRSSQPTSPSASAAHRRDGRRGARRVCELVALATAAAFAVPVGELTAATRRTPYVAFARQSAMYLVHVTFGLSYSEVGRAFGRDRTTAAYACKLIEDRRDDPAVDAVLDALESVCGALRQRLAVRP